MTKKGKRLYELPKALMMFFAWVSAGVVIFNLALLTANVFMRYVFKSPVKGTSEVVAMMMAWVAYAGMSYTLLTGKHMQLEAFYEKLKGRAKHIMSFVIYLLAAILFLFMIKASFNVFWSSWTIREKSVASVTVYVFIGKCGALVGWVLLAVQAVLMVIYSLLGIIHPDRLDPIGVYSEVPDQAEVEALIKDKESILETNPQEGGSD